MERTLILVKPDAFERLLRLRREVREGVVRLEDLPETSCQRAHVGDP